MRSIFSSDIQSIENSMAEEYNTSKQYTIGMYCIKDNILYRCKVNNIGSWDSSNWKFIRIMDEVSDLKSVLEKTLTLAGATKQNVPHGTDINNLVQIGSYRIVSGAEASSMANLPTAFAGIIIVGTLHANTRLIQVYLPYNNEIYFRYGNGTTWMEWQKIPQEIDVSVSVSWLDAEVLPNNVDVDSYREDADYRITNASDAATVLNLPVASAGIFSIKKTFHRTRFLQTYYAQGSNAVYYRFGTDSSWNDWKVTGQSVSPSQTTSDETVLIFGDSWADEATSSATKWPTFFMRETNVTVKNYAKNGAGIYGADDYSTNGTVGGQVAYAISDTSFVHSDVSTVFMVCGLNDFRSGRSVSTVVTAWKTLIDRIHTAFPNTRIICCINNQIFVNTDQLNYLRGVQDGLRQYGIPAYLILGWVPASLYNNDHVHLSETGHTMIATNMVALFRGGSISYVQNQYTQSNIGSYISEFVVTEMFSSSHITRKFEVIKTSNTSQSSQDITISSSSSLALNIPFCFPALNNENATEYIIIEGTSPETATGNHKLAETNEITISLPVSDAGKFNGITFI